MSGCHRGCFTESSELDSVRVQQALRVEGGSTHLGTWHPTVGPAAASFLRHLDLASKKPVGNLSPSQAREVTPGREALGPQVRAREAMPGTHPALQGLQEGQCWSPRAPPVFVSTPRGQGEL